MKIIFALMSIPFFIVIFQIFSQLVSTVIVTKEKPALMS